MTGAIKLILGYQIIALLASPLVGWSLAQTELPPILAIYIMGVAFLWPLGVIAYLALRS